jgi:hypothetical protein
MFRLGLLLSLILLSAVPAAADGLISGGVSQTTQRVSFSLSSPTFSAYGYHESWLNSLGGGCDYPVKSCRPGDTYSLTGREAGIGWLAWGGVTIDGEFSPWAGMANLFMGLPYDPTPGLVSLNITATGAVTLPELIYTTIDPAPFSDGTTWATQFPFSYSGAAGVPDHVESFEGMGVVTVGFRPATYTTNLWDPFWARYQITPEAVTPEPATLLLVGSGLGLAAWHRRHRVITSLQVGPMAVIFVATPIVSWWRPSDVPSPPKVKRCNDPHYGGGNGGLDCGKDDPNKVNGRNDGPTKGKGA